MNGSNVWGSLAPYGDVLPLFKWNIYKRSRYFPLKTVIIDDSLQITLGEIINKCQVSFGIFLISLLIHLLAILYFVNLVIFLKNIPFEQGKDVTKRRTIYLFGINCKFQSNELFILVLTIDCRVQIPK